MLLYKILVRNDQIIITNWAKSCVSRQWWQLVNACFSCITAWHAVVKAPNHKFCVYHMTQHHQCVCRCPWYIWKLQLEDFFSFAGFVSQIFVVAIMDISPMTQSFHCTFNAFYYGIDSALLFIAAVFSPICMGIYFANKK